MSVVKLFPGRLSYGSNKSLLRFDTKSSDSLDQPIVHHTNEIPSSTPIGFQANHIYCGNDDALCWFYSQGRLIYLDVFCLLKEVMELTETIHFQEQYNFS